MSEDVDPWAGLDPAQPPKPGANSTSDSDHADAVELGPDEWSLPSDWSHPANRTPEDEELDPLVPPGHTVTAQLISVQGGLIDLRAQVAAATARGETMAQALDRIADLESLFSELDGSGPATGAAFDLRVLVEWVRENVAGVVQRHLPSNHAPNWCAEWWRHPEAIALFEAARRSWLEAVGEPGNALAVFWEHLHHILDTLMAENSTFTGCTPEQHQPRAKHLAHRDPPESIYKEFEALTRAANPGGGAGDAEPSPAPGSPAPGSHGGPGVLASERLRDRNAFHQGRNNGRTNGRG